MKLPRFLIRLSIFLSEKTGGKKGESICARVYGNFLRHPKGWSKWAVKAIDKLFWFDPQHCRKAWLQRVKK